MSIRRSIRRRQSILAGQKSFYPVYANCLLFSSHDSTPSARIFWYLLFHFSCVSDRISQMFMLLTYFGCVYLTCNSQSFSSPRKCIICSFSRPNQVHLDAAREVDKMTERCSDGVAGRGAGVGQLLADEGEEGARGQAGRTYTVGIGSRSVHAGPQGGEDLYTSDIAPWLGAAASESSNSEE